MKNIRIPDSFSFRYVNWIEKVSLIDFPKEVTKLVIVFGHNGGLYPFSFKDDRMISLFILY